MFAVDGSVVLDADESEGGETLSLPSEASEAEVSVFIAASIAEAESPDGGDPLGSDIGIDSAAAAAAAGAGAGAEAGSGTAAEAGAGTAAGSVLLLARTPAAADGVKTKETV